MMGRKEIYICILFVFVIVVCLLLMHHAGSIIDLKERTFMLEESTKVRADMVNKESRLISLGEFAVTAYCPCEKCCGEFADRVTSMGHGTAGNICAVDYDVIPLDSDLYIPGYGWAKAWDVGGKIKGKRIDVLFQTHQEALDWGVKNLEIWEFVKKGGNNGTS